MRFGWVRLGARVSFYHREAQFSSYTEDGMIIMTQTRCVRVEDYFVGVSA